MEELLKKHKFYAGLIGVLAVYMLFYMFMVRPIHNKKKGMSIKKIVQKLRKGEGHLKNALKDKSNIPNKAVIAYHQQQSQALQNDKKAMLEFFKKKDVNLEKWFPEIEENGVDTLKLPRFRALYDNNISNLVKQYVDEKSPLKIGVEVEEKVGSGSFGQEETTPEQNVRDVIGFTNPRDIVIPSGMKKAQKEFWIIKGFLDMCREGKVKRVTSFSLGREKTDYNTLFSSREIRIKGKIHNKDVPDLINKILSSTFFNTVLKEVKIHRKDDYEAESLEVNVPWDPRPQKEREKEALKKFMEKRGEKTVPVTVSFTCLILDYKKQKKEGTP